MVEIVYALVVGRTAQARSVAGAWTWNLRRFGELRAARAQVKAFRRVKDREVRRLQTPGSARVTGYVRRQIARDDEARGATQHREMTDRVTGRTMRWTAIVWGAVALTLLVGSRHLITRGVPSIGELVPFVDGPADMMREWASGWRAAGLGSDSPAPTAFGLIGVAGFVSVGAMGLLRLLLTVGMLPLGALAAYRLAAPTGSRPAQLVTLVVYVANPVPYNALANGSWSALLLYAAAPVLLGRLARASRLAPFGPVGGEPGPKVRAPSLWRDVLTIGLVTALVGAVLPSVLAITVVLAAAIVLGSFLALTTRGDGRVLIAGVGGALVGALLHLPWTLDFLGPDATLASFLGIDRGEGSLGLDALLRFETGPIGAAPLGYAMLAAAALPLLIGRGWRHAWAVRGWTIALSFWGIAWVGQEGWLEFGLPAPDVLLVPAAAGLALAAGLGVSAFELDLPGYRFGWRQLASGAAALAVLAATIPVLGATIDGAWSTPAGDPARALRSLDDAVEELPSRILWLGDPDVLPLGGWELSPGVAYATTSRGTPRAPDLWSGGDDEPTPLVAEALDLAQAGETARLGRLLAPMAVRYLVVVERLAPAPWSTTDVPVPEELRDTLEAQLDLERLDVPEGLTVYENLAALPPRAAVAQGVGGPEVTLGDTARLDLSGAAPVLPDRQGPAEWTGPLEPGRVLVAEASSDRWRLEVSGEEASSDAAFGWANGFEVASGGDATLSYRTPAVRYGLIALQALVWIVLARLLLKARYGPETAGPPAHAGTSRDGSVA